MDCSPDRQCLSPLHPDDQPFYQDEFPLSLGIGQADGFSRNRFFLSLVFRLSRAALPGIVPIVVRF